MTAASRNAKYRATHRKKLRAQGRARYYEVIKTDPARLEKMRAAARGYRATVREWLAAYKLKRGCKDCGYRKHFAALQLDHEGPKRHEIADARSSIRRLKEEIASGRCVVRCANCHAIKTWRRQKQRRKKKS